MCREAGDIVHQQVVERNRREELRAEGAEVESGLPSLFAAMSRLEVRTGYSGASDDH